jgi:mannose PTS system EIID component
MTAASTASITASMTAQPAIPRRTWWTMFTRLFAIQGSWNYELLMGTGIAFCVEPALRELPGGTDGPAYREALARQARYFNAHPYLASLAVGALARVELDRVNGSTIERFRTALCGPLGSVGDRLVWAGWLPLCSLLALAAFGAGARAWLVIALFLVIYNLGHVALRVWGLREGWSRGHRVAGALGGPVFRQGPEYIARAGALLAGIALPAALARVIGPGRDMEGMIYGILLVTALGSVTLARLHGRVEGWRASMVVLAAFVLYAVAQHHG